MSITEMIVKKTAQRAGSSVTFTAYPPCLHRCEIGRINRDRKEDGMVKEYVMD